MPQGSKLSPILFIIYIDSVFDIIYKIKKKLDGTYGFADDLKVRAISKNEAIDIIFQVKKHFEQELGLFLNLEKCEIMKICKRNLLSEESIEKIKLVDEIKILGFYFDGYNGFKT